MGKINLPEFGERTTITLTLENDADLECAVMAQFEVDGQGYIALLPLTKERKIAGEEVYLYRFSEGPNGEPELDNIDDDDEYEAAADRYDELLDEEAFDQLFD